MATERSQREKNDLSRLSAWPHPAKSSVKTQRSKSDDRAVRLSPPKKTPRAGPHLHSVIAHELPALYNETYLRVLPLDPWRLFSFWEVTPDTSEAIEKTCPPLLRLYETEGKTITDYTIEKGTHSQYIRVPEPGRRYRLEYGVTTQNGRFIPLCASNTVDVPSARVREPVLDKRFTADSEKLIAFSLRSGMATVQAAGLTDNGSSRSI